MTRRHAGRQNQLDRTFGGINPQRDSPRPQADPDPYASVGTVRRHRIRSDISECHALPNPP
jgi:hypothetical protein